MTKYQMKEEFFELIINGKGKELNDRAFKLFEENKVTYGWYLIHNLYDNYYYEELINKKNLTKWELNYHLTNLKEHIEESLLEVEEQENLPFEKSQKQLLKEIQVIA